MATPPNIDNLTIPGATIVYFNDGTGERDLGYFESPNLEVEPKTEELKYFSNRSGKRRVAKTWSLSEELMIRFKLNEPVIENLQAFFKGGAIATLGDGTAAKVDQILALAGTGFQTVGQFYGLTAVTARQFVNYVYRKEVGGTFHDNSVEADALAGTPFALLTLNTDEAYIGKDTRFKEFYSDLATPGVFATLAVKYWNGAAWTAVTGLAGAGAGFDADGKVQFDLPGDWVKTTVNGVSAYFLQITAGTVTTPATVNHFRQNCVALTDYQLDPGAVTPIQKDGRVARIAAGMLVDGEEVKISFTYATWTSQKFAISGAAYIQGAARLACTPAAGMGVAFEINIPLCQLKPNGSFNLDDKKVFELPMMLEVLDNTIATPDYPFGQITVYED